MAGNVTRNETSQVEANTTNVDIDHTDATTDSHSGNVTWTSSGSNVNVTIDETKSVVVGINNQGLVNNTMNATVSTGGNSAYYNTGDGMAVGGDVNVWQVITTKLNWV